MTRRENIEAAWGEEIERRIRQIDSGEVTTIPWEEVRAKLHARLIRQSDEGPEGTGDPASSRGINLNP